MTRTPALAPTILAAAALLGAASAALAGPGSLFVCDGRLHEALDQWDRRSATGYLPGDTTNCVSMTSESLNSGLPYCAFHVEYDGEASASITLESLEPNAIDFDPHLAVYCAPFDPDNPTQNLFRLDDDSQGYPDAGITLDVAPGDSLVIVVSSYAVYRARQFGQFRLGIVGLRFSDPCECAPTDLNRDGLTNSIDLTILLADLGETAKGLAGDIDASGTVDDTDLSLLLDEFGEPCPGPEAIDPSPAPTPNRNPGAIRPDAPISRTRSLTSDDR